MAEVDPTTVTTHVRAYWSKKKKVLDEIVLKDTLGARSLHARPFACRVLYTCDPSGWPSSRTGTGTFGRVRLCEAPDLRVALEKTAPPAGPIIHSANCFFALKIMKKSEVVRLKQVEHIKNEKEILQDVNHPFIVVLCAAPAG